MHYRIICWLLIFFACFYGLGSYPLLDHNEGMYAAIARDMLRGGDYIIPHLNGVPYIEKPPMLYWLMAGSMALFGENEWAVRLVPALALFFTAWKMERFLWRATRSRTTGFTAALILVTSLPLLALGRMVLCDMLMTCFLTTALILFYEWYAKLHPPLQGQRYLLGFYVFLALAVLTKGFVAVILAGGAIATFLLYQRCPLKTWLRALSFSGILLFLIIIVPWHLAASIREPGFAYFYFINEHVLRFLNMREPHDYYTGPLWYYAERIPAYLIPWTLFLLLFFKKHAYSNKESILRQFLCCWFVFFLLFFSLAGGKANYYMIAGMPALVMLIALQFERSLVVDQRFIRGLATIALILIISTLEGVQNACNEGSHDLYPVCQIVSWPVIGMAACYVIAAIIACWRLPPRWVAPMLAANVLVLLPVLLAGVPLAEERVSQKPVADYLNALPVEHAAIYQEFEELSALAFYLDNPLVVVDSHSSDLLYGQHDNENPTNFISLADWTGSLAPMPMVVLNKRLDALMAANPNLCVMQRFTRVSVIKRCN